MRIIIRTKNLELTEELSAFAQEKIGSLKKFVDVLKDKKTIEGGKTLAEVFVDVAKETQHHKKGDIFMTKAMILLPGKKIMAEARASALARAIVDLKDELQQELKKYKFKHIENPRRERRKTQKNVNF